MTEQADERRIAACLKACEGLPTEGLERMAANGETIKAFTQRIISSLLQTQVDLLPVVPPDVLPKVNQIVDQMWDSVGKLSPSADSDLPLSR